MTDEITRLQARVEVLEDALRIAQAHVANNAQGWSVGRGASRDDLAIVDAALAASIPADPVANAGCCQPVKVKPLVWRMAENRRFLGADGLGCQYYVPRGEPDRRKRCEADHEARILSALEPAPVTPAPDVVEIDLRVVAMEEIENAADQSPWVPPEYTMNEVVSDCCAFLREPRDPATDAAKVEALAKAACGLLDAYSAIVGPGNPWGDSLRAALRAIGEGEA